MKKLLHILVLGISFPAILFAQPTALDSIYNISGDRLQLERGQERVYIYFWATWCPECVATIKKNFSYIKNLQKKVIIPVSTERNIKRLKYFKKKYSIQRDLYSEPSRKLIKSLDVKEVPLWTIWERKGNGWSLIKKQLGKLEE